MIRWKLNPKTFEETKAWGNYHLYEIPYNLNNSCKQFFLDIKLGIHYKYPICCVAYYLYLCYFLGVPAAAFIAAHLKNEKEWKAYTSFKQVPCPKCLKKRISK